MERNDIVIIGAGTAGYVAAIRAAQLGGKVTLVEREELGGTCLHRGCIPTKVLLRGAELVDLIQLSENFGVRVEGFSLDLAKLMAHKDLVVKTMFLGLVELLKANRINIVKGNAQFLSPKEIEVTDEKGEKTSYPYSKLLLVTGSCPDMSMLGGTMKGNILTTDEALTFHKVPDSMIIIGGGAVGVEFGLIYAKLGTKVRIIEMSSRIIPTEDIEVALTLEECLRRSGIKIVTSAQVQIIDESSAGNKKVIVAVKNGEEVLEGKEVLLAVGRRPNIDGLGLREIGVRFSSKGIEVNERMETNVHGIYAAGDVTGKQLTAHFASAQGVVAAENAMGKDSTIDERVVPRCIYTFPEVACVGLTEDQAREKGYRIKIGRFPFQASGKAATLGDQTGFVKIVSEIQFGEILGVHIIGAQATNLIGEAALAMCLGALPEDVAKTIHPHPTLSEALMEASLDIESRALHLRPRQ